MGYIVMPNTPKTFKLKEAKTAKPIQPRHRLYDSKRGSAAARGYDGTWEELRDYYLSQPENVMCACGCGEISTEVDHIEAIYGKEDPKRLDIRNLQAMTKRCHTAKTIRFDGGYGRKRDESEEGRAILAAMRAKAEERAASIEARKM